MLTRDPSFVPPAILPVTLRRGADRRRGISALTTAVTTGLALTEPRAARERLEEELRCALQARSVRLRDEQRPGRGAAARCRVLRRAGIATATAMPGSKSSSTSRGRSTTGRVS